MINTKHHLPATSRTLLTGILLLLFIATVHSSIDYCITNKAYDVVPLFGNQTVALTLGDYIRGYNLTFQSDMPLAARPFNPIDVVSHTDFNFGTGYKIVNADVFESTDKKWFQNGLIFAQKDSKTISIISTQFKGTRNQNQQHLNEPQQFIFKQQTLCFSASIVDQQGGVVIDCQTTDKDDPQDYLCYIDTSDKKSTPNCIQLDALDTAMDRKSQVLIKGDQVYLLTGSYSRDKASTSITYLTIYRVDSAQKQISFGNIVDGYQLNLGYDLVISDFDVLKNGTILIHDVAKSQLLSVDYTLDNQISLIGTPWVYGSEGVEIEVTNLNTVLIATKSYVEEWDLTLKRKVFRYELEKGDNNVMGIGANSYGVIVETDRNYLYVYQRIMGTVNYMLGSVYVGNKDYLISPYANVFYVFNDQQYEIYEISSGVLKLSSFEQSTNVTITAKSLSSSCKFTLQVLKLDSTSKIVEKRNITQKKFTAENSQAISLNLEDIYSGQYLTYELPESTDEIKFKLDHMAAYDVKTNLKDSLLTQIVNINETAYLLLGLTVDKAAVELCRTDDSAKAIQCNNIYNWSLVKQNPLMVTGRRRNSGQIVFVWTYAESQFEYLGYNNGAFTKIYSIAGQPYEFSSVVIGEDRLYLVEKAFATVKIFMDLSKDVNYATIDNLNYKPQTKDITGFYPRQVYLHPRNNELFYVKFPQHVCLMTLIGGKVPKTVECNKVIAKMVPDSTWDVIIGTYTYVVFSPEGIKEYTILGNANSELHTVNVPFTFPVYYNQFLNTAIFRSPVDGSAVYYKLNKPLSDCLFYSFALKNAIDKIQDGDSSDFFSTEGAWTISTQNWKSYRQSYNTKVSIQLIGDNKSFKEDIAFSIKVRGTGNETIDTTSNVTVVHYPTNITKNKTVNDVLSLPSAANQFKYEINPEKYLQGPKAQYTLVCDYCGNNITIEGAFKNKSENQEIIGAKSIIEVFNKHALVLTNNRINLVDPQGSLVTYKIVQHVKQCIQMIWDARIGLLAICQDETGQEVFGFDVNEDNITQWNSTYPIHEEAMISFVDEIIISQIDNSTYWMFVEDNDVTDLKQKINKKANVKAFIWTKESLEFKGILTSESFSIISDIVMPINDIDVVNGKFILASIGNVGIGYATLATQKDAPNVLVNPQAIALRSIDEVEDCLLDDTVFQQVQLVSNTSTGSSILVTSSTGLAMVLEFTFDANGSLIYKRIQQSFNRYATYPSVNWHAVTDNMLLLSYYNVDDGEEYITLYRRSNSTMIDFVEAITVSINTYQLGEHSILLTSGNVLFVSDVGNGSTDAKIIRYDLMLKYNLVMSYNGAGSFNKITLVATNEFSSEHTAIGVSFAKQDEESGVKWYTIMVIALIVVIIVGVGYGMYLKMMKNRKDKKVSLLTEGEQVDEVV